MGDTPQQFASYLKAEAVKWQKKALEYPIDDAEEAAQAPLRLKFYEQDKPWRDDKP